jgi:hypothetical protein
MKIKILENDKKQLIESHGIEKHALVKAHE